MERAVEEEIGEASQVLRERYVGWGGGVLSLLRGRFNVEKASVCVCMCERDRQTDRKRRDR